MSSDEASSEEWEAAVKLVQPNRPAVPGKTGSETLNEVLLTKPKKREEQIRTCFAFYDLDKSGDLDKREFAMFLGDLCDVWAARECDMTRRFGSNDVSLIEQRWNFAKTHGAAICANIANITGTVSLEGFIAFWERQNLIQWTEIMGEIGWYKHCVQTGLLSENQIKILGMQKYL